MTYDTPVSTPGDALSVPGVKPVVPDALLTEQLQGLIESYGPLHILDRRPALADLPNLQDPMRTRIQGIRTKYPDASTDYGSSSERITVMAAQATMNHIEKSGDPGYWRAGRVFYCLDGAFFVCNVLGGESPRAVDDVLSRMHQPEQFRALLEAARLAKGMATADAGYMMDAAIQLSSEPGDDAILGVIALDLSDSGLRASLANLHAESQKIGEGRAESQSAELAERVASDI